LPTELVHFMHMELVLAGLNADGRGDGAHDADESPDGG
jgi:hypothetical protein